MTYWLSLCLGANRDVRRNLRVLKIKHRRYFIIHIAPSKTGKQEALEKASKLGIDIDAVFSIKGDCSIRIR